MEIDVENVLIYVDDAVRYNAINDDLAELGQTHKTIAASTHTPTSFGSLLTGLLPPNSNIHSFKHSVPANVRSVFDIESHEVSIAAQGGMNHSIAEMFANPPRKPIDDVEPPFVHVARRPGGHAPYDGFDWDDYEYRNETALEYLWRVSSDPETARKDYYNGVDRSFEEFKRVLQTLERRGLRKIPSSSIPVTTVRSSESTGTSDTHTSRRLRSYTFRRRSFIRSWTPPARTGSYTMWTSYRRSPVRCPRDLISVGWMGTQRERVGRPAIRT